MPPGKFCKITPKNTQITPKNTHTVYIFFYFKGLSGPMAQCPSSVHSCVLYTIHFEVAPGTISAVKRIFLRYPNLER